MLTDRTGRSLRVDLDDLQGNRKLWDLVHAGIRYSAAHGATIGRRSAAGLLLGG